jgi:hypothetical protein
VGVCWHPVAARIVGDLGSQLLVERIVVVGS